MKNKRHNKKLWIIIKNSFFKYWIISNKTNSQTSKTYRPFIKRILIFLFVVLLVTLFSLLNWTTSNHYGVQLFINNIKNFFSFDSVSTFSGTQNNWILSFNFLWLTIKTTIVGTFIGFLIALFTSFLSSSFVSNKYISYAPKAIILFIRSFPELIFINLFTIGFFSEMAVIMIFIWFTWLWLHKYYLEAIENIDHTYFNVSIQQGNSKIRAFRKEVIPRLSTRFWVMFLYSFESNIRWSSILSALGVLGIGTLINFSASRDSNFSQLGVPVFIIFLFMIAFEITSVLMKKYLFRNINLKVKTKNYELLVKKINWQKIVKFIILIFLIAFTISVLVTINIHLTSIDRLKLFIKQMFKPNWTVFDINSSSVEKNPFLQILQLFQFSLLSTSLTVLFSLFFLYFTIWNFRNKKTTIPFRLFVTFIRLIPVVTFIFLINPLFLSGFTILVIVTGFYYSSEMTKKMYEIADTLDYEWINRLKLNGYSNRILFFKYILPSIKYDFLGIIIFAFEIGIRNAITLSVFSSSDLKIGHFINSYLNPLRYQPDKAMAYVWISAITIFCVNVVSTYIRTKLKK